MENSPTSISGSSPARLSAVCLRQNTPRARTDRSSATNTGESPPDHEKPPISSGSVVSSQPYTRPSIRTNARSPRPAADSTAPTPSTRPGVRGEASRCRSTPATMRATSGMLMPKAHRQERSASHPPSSGPTAAAAPMVEPHTANAWPRARPVNVAFSRASEVGSIIAPPTPWTNRARISSPPLGADAASRLVTPKTARPSRKIRRAPYRSLRRPVTRRSAAKVIAYDSWIHWASDDPMERSSMIGARITLTIVMSTTIRATPSATATRPSHWRAVGGVSAGSGTVLRLPKVALP